MRMLAHRIAVHQEACLGSDKRQKKKGGKQSVPLFEKLCRSLVVGSSGEGWSMGRHQRNLKIGGGPLIR